ncbi:MAG: glycosyltransferase, partial [Bacteroidaceae bacterium]|nr:glycosyltransferase [Bacteroidaceae bacterium]
MLSILIPTRDFTCYKLVSDLQRQAQAEEIDYEIIVAEDGSRDQVSIIANHKIEDLPFCRHIILHENIGRARIRNFLAAQASYDTLLFIDSDARVEKDDFIKTYISAMGKAPVTVGGLYHPFANFNPHKSLRFLYETKADVHRSAEERRKNPYMSLSTFNLMMSREAFNMTGGFDPNCRQYGYEDALMGW